MKEERIGIKNSKEKANKLPINRFLVIRELHETAIAPIAEITIMEPMQSKVSEISENTIVLSDDPRTPFKVLAYNMSSKMAPQYIAATQAYSSTQRNRNLTLMPILYRKGF
jgi:hypothetical protein